MFRFRARFLFIAVLALAATAQATPVTFSLQNGTFYNSGATMTGTVVIDTATGVLVSTDLTYTLGGSSVTFDQAFYYQGNIPALYGVDFPLTIGAVVDGPGDPGASPAVVDEFDLILPTGSLVGYSGGAVCTGGDAPGIYCGGGVVSEYYGRVHFSDNQMLAGKLVPLAAATPEPSEFALTLTGATLLTALMRRRRYRARLSK